MTELELAHALRTAAAEIDAKSFPFAYGAYARTTDGTSTLPTAPDAVAWCALGRTRYHLGDDDNSVSPGADLDGIENIGVKVSFAFDQQEHTRAAQIMRCTANQLEDAIPTTPEAHPHAETAHAH